MGGKARSQTARASRRSTRPDGARVARIVEVLGQTWGQATCELVHRNAFELLVATILRSQSPARRVGDRIDRLVNQVTPALFARYPDAHALAEAEPRDLEPLIQPTGFYRLKARQLREVAEALVARHHGEVPRTLGKLLRLPGITRKTANAVLGNFFGISVGVVVDSHVRRVSQRLGLTAHHDAEAVERDLMAVLPRERWIDIANELIWHGQRVCHAREPACTSCALASDCPSERPPDDPYGLGWS